ncbi:hypothetical protein CSKR_103490, partial [Clonorchis sinensis]
IFQSSIEEGPYLSETMYAYVKRTSINRPAEMLVFNCPTTTEKYILVQNGTKGEGHWLISNTAMSLWKTIKEMVHLHPRTGKTSMNLGNPDDAALDNDDDVYMSIAQLGKQINGHLIDCQPWLLCIISDMTMRPTCVGGVVVTRSPRMSDVRGSHPGTATGYALLMGSNKSETRVQCFPLVWTHRNNYARTGGRPFKREWCEYEQNTYPAKPQMQLNRFLKNDYCYARRMSLAISGIHIINSLTVLRETETVPTIFSCTGKCHINAPKGKCSPDGGDLGLFGIHVLSEGNTIFVSGGFLEDENVPSSVLKAHIEGGTAAEYRKGVTTERLLLYCLDKPLSHCRTTVMTGI